MKCWKRVLLALLLVACLLPAAVLPAHATVVKVGGVRAVGTGMSFSDTKRAYVFSFGMLYSLSPGSTRLDYAVEAAEVYTTYAEGKLEGKLTTEPVDGTVYYSALDLKNPQGELNVKKELVDITISGYEVSFVEALKRDESYIRVVYEAKKKVSGDISLKWESDRPTDHSVAWDSAAAEADRLWLSVYKDGVPLAGTYVKNNGTYNVSGYVRAKGVGDYRVTVNADGVDNTTAEKKCTFAYKLDSPAPSWDKETARWIGVSGADQYLFCLYYKANKGAAAVRLRRMLVDDSVNAVELASYLTTKGVYYFTVQAIANGNAVDCSNEVKSLEKTVDVPEKQPIANFRRGVATKQEDPYTVYWDAFPDARNYRVVIMRYGVQVTATYTKDCLFSIKDILSRGGAGKYQISVYAVNAAAQEISLASSVTINFDGNMPEVAKVVVTPADQEAKRRGVVKLQAVVEGTNISNQTVIWSVSGATNSKISTRGVLTIGGLEASSSIQVTATSVLDITKSGTVTVKILLPGTYYTVKYDSVGGSAVATETVDNGEALDRPEDPTRRGYTFLGWTLKGEDYDFTQPVTANLTLKAKWEKTVAEPTTAPTVEPTAEPATEPTVVSTTEPATEPTVVSATQPSTEPTTVPTTETTTEPTTESTGMPTIAMATEPVTEMTTGAATVLTSEAATEPVETTLLQQREDTAGGSLLWLWGCLGGVFAAAMAVVVIVILKKRKATR